MQVQTHTNIFLIQIEQKKQNLDSLELIIKRNKHSFQNNENCDILLPELHNESSNGFIKLSKTNIERKEDMGKPSAFEKLTSEFVNPTSSSEAVAINSICMILKTLQPKRKDVLPVSNKYISNKEIKSKRIEDRQGLNPLLNKIDDSSIQRINLHHSKDACSRINISDQARAEPYDCSDVLNNLKSDDTGSQSHKRCSSQANKRIKEDIYINTNDYRFDERPCSHSDQFCQMLTQGQTNCKSSRRKSKKLMFENKNKGSIADEPYSKQAYQLESIHKHVNTEFEQNKLQCKKKDYRVSPLARTSNDCENKQLEHFEQIDCNPNFCRNEPINEKELMAYTESCSNRINDGRGHLK